MDPQPLPISPVLISPVFREAIERQRDEINARVHLLFKRGAKFDPAELLDHVRFSVGPIIDAIHQVLPERVLLTTNELLSISLELFEANQIGSESRCSLMSELWADLLPQVAKLIGRDPRRVVGSLCNAVHFLSQYDQKIASNWLHTMKRMACLIDNTEQLLACGRCAAWISGFSPYRLQALEELRSLPPQFVGCLLGLAEADVKTLTPDTVEQCLARLENDRWASTLNVYNCNRGHSAEEFKITSVKVCCDFRGFGGALSAPPTVCVAGEALLVFDGEQVWKLIADQFGSILIRCQESFSSDTELKSAKQDVYVDVSGVIRWGKIRHKVAGLAGCSSQAFDGQTLAVTIPTSFRVFLFALQGDGR